MHSSNFNSQVWKWGTVHKSIGRRFKEPRKRLELPPSELSQELSQNSLQAEDAMDLNVGDMGTAEPGGKEGLTGAHRWMVSRLWVEAKVNSVLN